jgi:hypothetical protein
MNNVYAPLLLKTLIFFESCKEKQSIIHTTLRAVTKTSLFKLQQLPKLRSES